MENNNQIITYLQNNKILALKLDHAVSGVGQQVAEQIKTISAGATRLLYYTSCFTDEYNDVCQRQKTEDLRFRDNVYQLLRHGDVILDMLKIYFSELLRYKTSQQLEYIKQWLMAANIHIAASSLTNAGFVTAAASVIRMSFNPSTVLSSRTASWMSGGVFAAGFYGIIQKAADSARRLHMQYPAYYSALYAHNQEMMYFLVEPVFQRAGALNGQRASDSDIVNIITRLIR